MVGCSDDREVHYIPIISKRENEGFIKSKNVNQYV